MAKVTQDRIKEMMDRALHFGHQTQRWNPKMRKFIYGSKNGVHIFDLDKTALYLDRAIEFIKHAAASGQMIMFVSTKPQAARLIQDSAKEVNCPYVIYRWIPGLITNFSTIKRRVKYFNKLLEEDKEGGFDKYTKKEATKLKKEIVKLEDAFGGIKDMDKLPDIVFVADVVRDKIVVTEAKKRKLKVVAITDSNADPSDVDYAIPANDDAVSSLEYIVGNIKDAIAEGKGKNK